MQGKKVNYRKLDNPFSDSEEDVFTYESTEMDDQAYITAASDGPPSLKEVRKSEEWPKWQQAIRAKLDQLHAMGTWTLVDSSCDIIPITNKLVVQQMDIKGAYLNGILKERVYMHQPEGFEDGTGKICLLVKTLYGLKQSGCEWNIQFDVRVRKHGFLQLRSDPCVYVRRQCKGDLEIITVWVDDLLLFATLVKLMSEMKEMIRGEWEVTDLGEPAKIVGIEIQMKPTKVIISQKQYIESILNKEGMERANPVGMPMDLKTIIEANPDGTEGSHSNSYARLLGELQYLANATRLDIAFTVNRLASYTANPSLQHMGTLKRLLRYLSGTRSFGITYSVPNIPAASFI